MVILDDAEEEGSRRICESRQRIGGASASAMLQRMDVRTALAALPEKRIHPARRIAAWMARFSILDEPPTSETTSDYRKPASRPATRRIASDSRHALVAKLRFDRVGILRIRILLSTIDSELFVDDTETVRLTVGRSVGKTRHGALREDYLSGRLRLSGSLLFPDY